MRELVAFEPQALISIQYNQILKPSLFDALACPCLNLHFALLPRHRGVSPIAWSIFEGDEVGGVTLHHMIPNIDAGDVIAQRSVPVPADMTARQLYDALTQAARSLFAESYPFPRELLQKRLTQVESNACYHRAGDFDFSAREIDWDRQAQELHRWIRAMIFPPLQCPEFRHEGRRVRVHRIATKIGDTQGAAPGRVVREDAAQIEVAAVGGSIRIVEFEEDA